MNFGIEQPDSKVDAGGSGGSGKDRAPDFGANVRWERAGLGHVQRSALVWQPFRSRNLSLGVKGLYGINEVKSGATGDDWRVQVGIIYSLF